MSILRIKVMANAPSNLEDQTKQLSTWVDNSTFFNSKFYHSYTVIKIVSYYRKKWYLKCTSEADPSLICMRTLKNKACIPIHAN